MENLENLEELLKRLIDIIVRLIASLERDEASSDSRTIKSSSREEVFICGQCQ